MIGRGIGAVVSKGLGYLISGFGDYKIKGNTLMTGGLDPPEVINSVDNGGVIVRHREYLFDVLASETFNINTMPINPGIVETFPWLSNVAQHFEQYRIRGLLFEFKSLSSDAVLSAATSSALGSVIMATQYNALDVPFENKFQMENYEYANSSKPSLSFLHPVECVRSQTSVSELYVRGGVPAANSDIRLYDLGNFSIATVGMQAADGVAGELWITYEVELYKPKLLLPANLQDMWDFWSWTTGGSNANPFLTAVQAASATMTGSLLSGHTYAFPPALSEGIFLVTWDVLGTAANMTGPTLTYTNCTGINFFTNYTVTAIASGGSSCNRFFCTTIAEVDSINATIGYGTGMVLPSSPTAGDFAVARIPNGLNILKDKIGELPLEDGEEDLKELVQLVKFLCKDHPGVNALERNLKDKVILS